MATQISPLFSEAKKTAENKGTNFWRLFIFDSFFATKNSNFFAAAMEN
jgi:hypothetical protein